MMSLRNTPRKSKATNKGDVEPLTSIPSITKHKTISTPVSGSGESKSQRSGRASSPLLIKRHEEKEELAHLNTRFAGYIDYVRRLETENADFLNQVEVLKTQLRTSHGDISPASDKVKRGYEKELGELRKMVDKLANEKAGLELQLDKEIKAKDDFHNRLNDKEVENRRLAKRVETAESQLNNITLQYEKCQVQLGELAKLQKNFDRNQKSLTEEILRRTDLENRIQTIQEELDFCRRMHEDERKSLMAQQQKQLAAASIVSSKVTSQKKDIDYESRLAEELRVIRHETASDLERYKNDLEEQFHRKLVEIESLSKRGNESVIKNKDELNQARREISGLLSELSDKEMEAKRLRKRVSELETMMEVERGEYESQLSGYLKEIDSLKRELANKFDEFADLMQAKIVLDQEIMLYRKMLEGEETRCQISGHDDHEMQDSSFSRILGGLRGTDRRKRPLDFDDVDEVDDEDETYQVELDTKGNVCFSDEAAGSSDCVSGKNVTLKSTSRREINIGSFALTHEVDGDTVTYNFPRNSKLKPGASFTVWSQSSGMRSNPPVDFVMNNDDFKSGSNVTITLRNDLNEEECSCKLTREVSRKRRRPFKARRFDDKDNGQCGIM